MILKEKELSEFRTPIHVGDATGLSLEQLKLDLEDCSQEMGIPASFEIGQVKTGNVFNSEQEDCIIMYHPQHEKDYYKFCFRLMWIGKSCKVWFYSFGRSKQLEKMYAYDQAVKGAMDRGASASSARIMGRLFVHGVKQRKAEEEQMYYDTVNQVIDTVFTSN